MYLGVSTMVLAACLTSGVLGGTAIFGVLGAGMASGVLGAGVISGRAVGFCWSCGLESSYQILVIPCS